MFLRNKADNASILKHLDNFTHEYSVLNENMTVNDRWNIVTSKVTDIINRLYIRNCESLCLSDETVKAVGPFYLVSMPGEVKYPTQGVNV